LTLRRFSSESENVIIELHIVREIKSCIQRIRKNLGLIPINLVDVHIDVISCKNDKIMYEELKDLVKRTEFFNRKYTSNLLYNKDIRYEIMGFELDIYLYKV
jgi:hypothetical protein